MLIDLGNSYLCSYDSIKNLYELFSFFSEKINTQRVEDWTWVCNPNTQEAEGGEWQVQVNLDYIARSYLKN